jgi:DNA-directed RNA polymerase subunit F
MSYCEKKMDYKKITREEAHEIMAKMEKTIQEGLESSRRIRRILNGYDDCCY